MEGVVAQPTLARFDVLTAGFIVVELDQISEGSSDKRMRTEYYLN